MANQALKAIIWDFGGVFSSSPFDAFRAYEEVLNEDQFLRDLSEATGHDFA